MRGMRASEFEATSGCPGLVGSTVRPLCNRSLVATAVAVITLVSCPMLSACRYLIGIDDVHLAPDGGGRRDSSFADAQLDGQTDGLQDGPAQADGQRDGPLQSDGPKDGPVQQDAQPDTLTQQDAQQDAQHDAQQDAQHDVYVQSDAGECSNDVDCLPDAGVITDGGRYCYTAKAKCYVPGTCSDDSECVAGQTCRILYGSCTCPSLGATCRPHEVCIYFPSIGDFCSAE